jgi:hypothetical protein
MQAHQRAHNETRHGERVDVLTPASTPMELLRLLVAGSMGHDEVPPPWPAGGASPRPLPPAVAHDFRMVARAEPFKRGRAVGTRAWTKIAGLTWHQTASGHLDESHSKLLGIPAHILLHRSGRWSILHALTDYMQHGHALNGGTIGIEVDARAAGVENDEDTFWRSPREIDGYHEACEVDGKKYKLAIGRTPKHPGRWHPPQTYDELVAEATPAQLAAIPDIMAWCCGEVAANGGHVSGNWAHCQGDRSRCFTDPGSKIWKAVEAAERAHPDLGLVDRRDMKLGSGKPIPKEWRLA